MVKKTIGIRLEPDQVAEYERRAQAEHRTVTEVILAELVQARRVGFVEAEKREIEERLERLESLTRKRVSRTRRISIGFSAEEYRRIDEAAHERRVSKAQYLRKIIMRAPPLPELPT